MCVVYAHVVCVCGYMCVICVSASGGWGGCVQITLLQLSNCDNVRDSVCHKPDPPSHSAHTAHRLVLSAQGEGAR